MKLCTISLSLLTILLFTSICLQTCSVEGGVLLTSPSRKLAGLEQVGSAAVSKITFNFNYFKPIIKGAGRGIMNNKCDFAVFNDLGIGSCIKKTDCGILPNGCGDTSNDPICKYKLSNGSIVEVRSLTGLCMAACLYYYPPPNSFRCAQTVQPIAAMPRGYSYPQTPPTFPTRTTSGSSHPIINLYTASAQGIGFLSFLICVW